MTLGGSTAADRIRFLVRGRYRDVDQDGECRVTFDNVNGWRLSALADPPPSEAECQARCLSW